MDEGWLTKVGGVLKGVRTPLSLGGLTVVVLCVIYNRILGLGFLSTISGSQTTRMVSTMVTYVFWLAVVAIVLGFIGYLIRPSAPNGGKGQAWHHCWTQYGARRKRLSRLARRRASCRPPVRPDGGAL
jgi:hypothetical protein